MDKILLANGFKLIESEHQRGFFVKTYKKYRKGNKYLVKILPKTDFFRIIFMDKIIITGSSEELEKTLKDLSLDQNNNSINYINTQTKWNKKK